MSSPASGAVRSVRAGLLGAVCVALALAGHLLGGGRLPSLWMVLVLSVPMGALSLAVAARRRGLRAIGLTVAGSQLLLHEAFMWSAAGASCALTGDPHAHLSHATVGPLLDCAAMPGMSSPGSTAHFATGAMLFAHVVAGLVTTVVLAYGESLVWRVWHRILRLTPVIAVPVLARRQPAARSPRAPLRPRLMAGPTRRRGPPLRTPAAV